MRFSLKNWVKINGVWNKGLRLKPILNCNICGITISRRSKRCKKHANLGICKKKPPWNKGLTKNDSRIAKLIEKGMPKRFGISPWNKGKKGILHSPLKGKIRLATRKEIHKTDESKIWRQRIEYRLWRRAVFIRDNWICQKCKIRGTYLHPHHIQNFSQYLGLRFATDNGITFCRNCHKEFHHIFGCKNNNLEQIKRFLE